MKKDYLFRTWILTVIVLVLLCLAYFITPLYMGDFVLKKVDILSDLRNNNQVTGKPVKPSSTVLPPEEIRPDSCHIFYNCIEDFTSDNSTMKHFYRILDSIPVLNRPVRIGFFGDSFIEADIITADIREQLQEFFGGQGVGYMPITSPVSGYRRSIIHKFQHFTTSSLIHTGNKLGISGYNFMANQGATVYYEGTTYKKRLNSFSTVTLLYEGNESVFASYSINQGKVLPLAPDPSPGIHISRIKAKEIQSIAFTFSPGMLLYGIFLDGEKGIAVDNFSVRGHSGMNLLNIPDENLQQTNTLVPYDLIVLQYGLNVAGTNTSNYETYKKSMLENIAHIQEAFPQASILLMSIGDRNTMQSGQPITMQGVHQLLPVQQEIAAESGIAFWNTFEVMGGEASMASYVKARPPLAAKDYTHLTHEGGKIIATKFVEALLYGKRIYDQHHKHIKPDKN